METLFNLEKPDTGSMEQERTLEDGEVYVCRHGKLEHLSRAQDDGMRQIRITDEAYQAAMNLGQRLRRGLHGYKPDASLVASALILEGCRDEYSTKAKEVIGNFVVKLFKPASS